MTIDFLGKRETRSLDKYIWDERGKTIQPNYKRMPKY